MVLYRFYGGLFFAQSKVGVYQTAFGCATRSIWRGILVRQRMESHCIIIHRQIWWQLINPGGIEDLPGLVASYNRILIDNACRMRASRLLHYMRRILEICKHFLADLFFTADFDCGLCPRKAFAGEATGDSNCLGQNFLNYGDFGL